MPPRHLFSLRPAAAATALAASLLIAACQGDSAPEDDARAPDPPAQDAGPADTAQPDATTDATLLADADTPTPDAGPSFPAPDFDGCLTYHTPGPYVVGVTTVDLDGVPVEIWYPAQPGSEAGKPKDAYDMRQWLPEAERQKIPDDAVPLYPTDAWRDLPAHPQGGFPLVLFSHGLAAYRMQSTFLTVFLASHGYVVASPDHPERGLARILELRQPSGEDRSPDTLRATIAKMRELTTEGARFANLVDFSRIAATGHSAGGNTALAVRDDAEILTTISYTAPGRTLNPENPRPVFFMSGMRDRLIPHASVERAYDTVAEGDGPIPHRLFAIADAGHLAFGDICEIGREQGGVLQIARDNGVRVPTIVATLSQDGCRAEDLPPTLAWPMIRHYTVAHLREVFGQDPEPVGLGPETAACLGEVVYAWRD